MKCKACNGTGKIRRKRVKSEEYYLTAFHPVKMEWYTWYGWTIERLKPLADLEGLVNLHKVPIKK